MVKILALKILGLILLAVVVVMRRLSRSRKQKRISKKEGNRTDELLETLFYLVVFCAVLGFAKIAVGVFR